MASLLSYLPVLNRLVGDGEDTRPIDIPPVEIHNVETAPEKRPRTLKHLLRANHVNHSILYNDLRFHNHMPHALCSAYLLGASESQLHNVYDAESKDLEPWKPSPAEVTQGDWREFLGDKRYQRAYVDFFEDSLAMRHGYDWKKVVEEYMFGGKEPLVNSLISGLGHPLIHLGYAYEMENKEIAMEALAMTTTQYSFLHKYLDDPSYTKPSPFKSASTRELLGRMAGDKRFDIFETPSADNLDPLFEEHESLVTEYWNAWSLDDPKKQFEESQEVAVSLLMDTVSPGTHSYNFYVVHLLTTSHAVRILLPMIPAKFHVSLVRQWWLFTIAVYAIFKCPKIDPDYTRPGDVAGQQWNYVEDKAVNGAYSTDAHFLKAVRAMREAARTWGDVHERYLAAAVRCHSSFGCDLAMAPPSKRRKRNIVVTSEDEADPKPPVNTLTNYLIPSPDAKNAPRTVTSRPVPVSPSPTRKSSRLVTSQPSKPALKPLGSYSLNSSSAKSTGKSASVSPEKNRAKSLTKGKLEEKGKSADLKTLFSRQAERAPLRPPAGFDDIISDPISDEDDVGEHRAATTSRVGVAARKRFKELNSSSSIGFTSAPSSQKFLRPSLPVRQHTVDDEQRPWSERFAPVSLEELAVHKKKVADVGKWLEDVMAGRIRQRLLILKGAAGTGKTTTLRLLAKKLHCELLEWRNPTATFGGPQGSQSVSAQFEEFLGRGGTFSQLDFGLEDTPSGNDSSSQSPKIMVIEEFPNTFSRSSTVMTSFRKAVLQFLQPPKSSITPLVMVISETLLTTTSASADSFTAHRLLGPEITRHPAPTLLASALELIVQKEARKSGRRREIGDIRSAISSLQFLCLKGDADAEWGSQVNFGKPKRSVKGSVSMTQGEVDTLQLVSQREASLGIFHAVGKVVYNKRAECRMDPQSVEGRAEILPNHLASYSRPHQSEVVVESLMDETGTDTHTFISALHENFLLSCEPGNSSDTNSFLDYMGGCIDYLSESDLLCPSWDVFFGGSRSLASNFSSRDSASHVLRQEEIAFQVATRGLLLSLPSPVKRIAAGPRRHGVDAYKMFYPTSLKLWREKEELEGLVDHWSTVLLKGGDAGQDVTDGASAFRRPKSTASSTWLGGQGSQRNTVTAKQSGQVPTQTQNKNTALLSLGSSARREMLLERLPYMAHIARRRKTPSSIARLRDLEKVISFSGIGTAADEDAVDAEEDAGLVPGEAWATDKPTEEASPRKKGLGLRQGSSGGTSSASLNVHKLVLSDDDIEDD
ncbi:cell cycle checkpoint protein RAD17 [Poronia punctata]|nr:cell cycle checkpoint protein RAD17 [Poronia punctata]